MGPYKGDYPTGFAPPLVFMFSAFDSNDPSASVTVTGLAVGDIKVFKDGGLTERSSTAGFAVDTDVDGITGVHFVSIDIDNNDDAGFFAAGSEYDVVVSSITIDAATVNFHVGSFSIERAGGALAKIQTVDTVVDGIAAKLVGITLLNEWLGAIAGKQNADATALTEIKATGAASGTYDPNTDSTEGLRDRLQPAAADALVALDLDHLINASVADEVADDSIIAKMVDRSSTADWSSFIHTEDSLRALSEEISAIGSASGGGFNFAPVGSNALEDQINDSQDAVDKSTSPATVGIPVTGHAFLAGHEVTISGTTNYNDTYVIDSVTANEVVIVATYNAETFSSTDNIDSSIKTTTIEGAETTNTFAAVSGQDGVYHVIDDDGGNNFTIAYRFEIGGGRLATEAVFTGFLNGGNDNALIQAYDFVGSAWETRKQFDGQGGSVNQTVVVPLLARNTGTSGVDFGVVFLRITDGASSTNPTLNTDSFLVEAVGVGQTAGYQNGQIWLDTVDGTDSAEKFVDGTSDRPVKTMANVVSLVAAGLSPDLHVLNGSSVTLGANSDNYSFFGDNWTLALASQSVVGAYFQGARVTGIGTSSSEVHYEGCDVGTMSVQIGHFDFCAFDGTVTMTLAGDYNYHNCYSKVAGSGSPTFAKTAGQAITAQWRNWQGGITFSGLQVGDTLTIGGRLGTIDLGSPGGAVAIEIRGTYKEITNVGSASVNTDGAIKGVDVADVKVVTDKFAFTVANLVNSNVKAISDDTTAADNLEALMDGVLVAVVNDGSATTTAFAADGFTEATDDHFKGRLATFLTGALLYQQTDITGYDAAGGTQGSQEFTVTALTEAPAEDVIFIVH